MLVVKNISKKLGEKVVLQNINFCLKKGEITALVGPNGAGKTTLMRCLIGFYNTDGGQIIFNNKNLISCRNDILKEIAYVPEIGGLYPEMKVCEYLQFMADIKHVGHDDFVSRYKELIEILALESVVSQRCDILSKGFRRRVALAGALIAQPSVLILDEPTEGLDPGQKQHLRLFLKNYSKKNIVLISTHIMEEVEMLASRVILIKDGKLVCDTTPEDLKKITPQNSIENSFCTIVGD